MKNRIINTIQSEATETELQGIDRRHFLGGAGLLALSGATVALTGCAPNIDNAGVPDSNNSPNNDDTSTTAEIFQPDETLSCDIVVVGAGGSGLAAAVQASELGASVICVESQGAAGGNLNGVEGCFGIGSDMQRERDITIDPGETIRSELSASQFRASGLGYVDMVHASGENIDWLVEQGVQFSDIDADKGDILVFHRFGNRGMQDYVQPMVTQAESNGVTFLYETKGEQLIVEGGRVTGCYATQNDDKVLQINARAVILATGGFADNDEYLGEMGLAPDKIRRGGLPGHDGSGHEMAIAAGALSNRPDTALLAAFYVNGTPGYYEEGKFAFVIGVAAPYSIWLNEKGERYVNEDFTGANIMLMSLPYRQNKDNFVVMDTTMMSIFLGGDPETDDQVASGIAEGSIFKADTTSALANAIKLDAEVFASTVERYNGFVQTGSDQDYGKSPDVLMPLVNGPFYAIKPILEVNTTIGSIKTDRSFCAIDSNQNPIDGLYVVGVEGAMLWANVYTINVSGGCNANNVNSGRTAAKDAIAKL